MNNKAMWIAAAVIVIAVGAYLVMGKSKTGQAPTNETGNSEVMDSQESAAPAAKASSVKDLLALGTSQKCTYSDDNSSGTFYVSGGKSRGDFTASSGTTTTKGHMIADSKTSYVWMDGQRQGYKMSLEDVKTNAQANSSQPSGQNQGVDVNKEMNFNCESWTADSSMFALPDGIEFIDLAAMMDPAKMMEAAQQMKQ